jgi:CHAT domain-containing protein/Tfp pilus assembly protein PilF
MRWISILGLFFWFAAASAPGWAQSEDPAAAISAANVQVVRLDREGKYAEGLALALKTLDKAEKLLGKEHPDTLTSLNDLALLYSRQGQYGEAEPLLRRALEARERVLGKEHPNTLESLNNLAGLYFRQGQYGEAEPLYQRALEASERVLGKEHPDTLTSISNLALLYSRQGQYGEAEPLYRRALEASERVLGKEHPDTLLNLNNLAELCFRQGRYGEAEPLYRRALEARERVLGKEHPNTLTSISNLAGLYDNQGRYGEAELLYQRALKASERVLGKEHPGTLTSVNNLAGLYFHQGRYGEMVPLLRRALEARERVLGKEHPDTLESLNNLAVLYERQGRYSEAEPLYRRSLETSERVLGKEHPNTLLSLGNLAVLYESQGQYGEAEPLYRRALEARERVLGKEHPDTLVSLGNLAGLLAQTGNAEEALRRFLALDNRLAFWLDAEIGSTQGAAVRRKILESHSGEQNAMYSLAFRHPSESAYRFAADVALRWKKRLAQEDAYLSNLMRTSQDPRIVEAAKSVRERRSALANAALDAKAPAAEKETLKERLEAAEAELRRQSGEYRRHMQAKRATALDVQDALPLASALVEYRFFNPFDFKTNKADKLHLLAAVLKPVEAPVVIDLGEADATLVAQHYLIDAAEREKDNISLPELRRSAYDQLIAPLKGHLEGVKTLILAPDGPLHALPFDALLTEEGKPLLDVYAIRMVQTGRDLVARDRTATGKGLVAFGGIEFGAIEAEAPGKAGVVQLAQADGAEAAERSLDLTREQLGGFKPLKHSGEEVEAISKLYGERRGGEPAPVVYQKERATKTRLKALASPPRALHLATHGFYLRTNSIAGHPLLQSGVALAGANAGMAGKRDADGENGVLQAIEAQTLNLLGTELVVLSACQTGQGTYDYSEGLEGLPRAFYVAGAKNVLVALWNVGDESTKEFMTMFYDYWTRQPVSDPAAALIETKKYFMIHPNPDWRNPQIWAAFVLYEG